MTDVGTPIVRATTISKSYGGVVAIRRADIEVVSGEIHALVGENGAGKSTLVKIISGVTLPDAGRLDLRGTEAAFGSAVDAQAAGIALVAQELSLFPDLTVRENMFPRKHPRRLGLIDGAAIDRAARPVLEQLGLDIAMHARVRDLTLADQQLLEIARAMVQRPSLLILDEPTSAQPRHAVARLESVLRRLTADGLAVLYISHFLEEVMRMADRVTVMRDGVTSVTGARIADTSLDSLVNAMIGNQLPAPPVGVGKAAVTGKSPLVLDNVTVAGELEPVTLRVAPGDTVGVVGLQGAGHLSLLEVICGRRAPSSGQVTLPSGVKPRSLRHAMAHGLAFLPSDRKRFGLMLDKPLWENVAAARWLGVGDGSMWERRPALKARCDERLRRLRVRGDADTLAGELSGGNQQKVVFAKLLEVEPDLLVLDDPTRGVDVGARAEMHQVVRDFAAKGRAVLVTSTDLTELVELCDRVVVLQRGRVVATLGGTELTEQSLSKAMNAGFVQAGQAS
jgi:ABC-type sugar transport system ATPase subunit